MECSKNGGRVGGKLLKFYSSDGGCKVSVGKDGDRTPTLLDENDGHKNDNLIMGGVHLKIFLMEYNV